MPGIVELFLDIWPRLLNGYSLTLVLTFIPLVLGFILGISLALARLYGNIILKYISIGYIEVIRGTPLLVQLFIIYFALPNVGIKLSPFMAAIIGFTINSAAYQAEYFRGALQSIGSGQMIAARSIGMSTWKSIKNIILPQGLRISIPAWSNEVIYLLKYTSLAYIIQVKELSKVGYLTAAENFMFLEIFLIIAIIYLFNATIFTEIIDQVEKRVRIPGLGTEEGGAHRGTW